MKKLFLLSLALVGLMSFSSCKKTLAPSAITVDNTVARVTVTGNVKFMMSPKEIFPAIGANTVVTATAVWKESGQDVSNTFSTRPDANGIYSLPIPIKYNAAKITISNIQAVVDVPNLGVFKGQYAGEPFPVNKNETATDKNITCNKE